MKKMLAIVFAALGALAVHALILMFGGLLSSPAASHRGTEVRNVELRPGRKSADRVPPARAAQQPKPAEPVAKVEEPAKEPPAQADALAKADADAKAEAAAKAEADAAAKAEALAKAEAPAQAAHPTKTETPKAPDATSKEARIAKTDSPEPAPAVTAAPPPPAADPKDVGPAQLAAARVRDAAVGGGEGEEEPSEGAAPAPSPVAASAEPPATELADAADSQPVEQAPPVSVRPVPSVVQPVMPEAAAEVPPVAPAVRPAPQPLHIPSLSSPKRIGAAWDAVAAKIGPVPPSAGVAPVPVTPRRTREIPPVDVFAATARTQVPYRPLNLGGREPTKAALGPFVAAAPVAPAAAAAPAALAAPAAPVAARPASARGGASMNLAASASAARAPVVGAPRAAAVRSAGAAAVPAIGAIGAGSGRVGAGTGSALSKGTTAARNSGTTGSSGPGGGQPADRGMLAPGSQVRQEAVARIAWGNADEASRTIDIGRMQLVTVDADLKIIAGIGVHDGAWSRTSAPTQMGSYSNRVRVVDHVAGFAEQSALCGPGEHLAVIVPVGLDRRIEKAMDQAARREGLSRDQVAACYGRLVTQATGIEFQVDRVERRAIK
jgi:hypothetical protein